MEELFEQKKTVTKNALWLFFGQVFGRFLRMVIIIYPASLFSKESWGAFNYTLGIVTLLTALADIGISILVTREANKRPELRREYISTAFFIKFFLIITLGFFFVLASHWFGDEEEIRKLLPFMLLIFIFDAFRDFGSAIARASERMEKEGINNVITNAFIVGLGFWFIYISPTALSLSLAYALGTGLGLLSIAYSLRDEIKHLFTHFNKQVLRHIAFSAWPFGVLGLMGIIMINTDLFLIKWLMSLKDVALYSAPQKLIQLLYIIPGFISSAFFPALARHTRDSEKFSHLFETALTTVFLISVPLALGSIVLGSPIINFLYDETFAESVLTFRILALTIIFVGASVAVSNVIYAHNKEKGYIIISFFAILGNFVLDLLLIPVLGIAGAAIATFVNQLLINIYAFYKAKQICRFRLFAPLPKIFFAGFVMCLAAYAMNYLDIHVAANIVLSAFTYFSILILLKESSLYSFLGLRISQS